MPDPPRREPYSSWWTLVLFDIQSPTPQPRFIREETRPDLINRRQDQHNNPPHLPQPILQRHPTKRHPTTHHPTDLPTFRDFTSVAPQWDATVDAPVEDTIFRAVELARVDGLMHPVLTASCTPSFIERVARTPVPTDAMAAKNSRGLLDGGDETAGGGELDTTSINYIIKLNPETRSEEPRNHPTPSPQVLRSETLTLLASRTETTWPVESTILSLVITACTCSQSLPESNQAAPTKASTVEAIVVRETEFPWQGFFTTNLPKPCSQPSLSRETFDPRSQTTLLLSAMWISV